MIDSTDINNNKSSVEYDALGRVKAKTDAKGNAVSPKYSTTYTYDAANNPKSFVLKHNGVTKTNTTYDYDNMNRLWKVYENGIQTAAYTYDANGNRQTITYNTSANTTNYTYNLASKLISLTNKKGTTTLSSYAYTYYLDGNQATKTDHTGKVTTYGYDDLGRLESESVQGDPAIIYTYDDYNNRATMTVGTEITRYVYDKNNRLKTETKTASGTDEITRYYYDNNGNQTCKTIETTQSSSGGSGTLEAYILEESVNQDIVFNEYDGFNQLKRVTTGGIAAEYQYNADGQRTTKSINNTETRHIWDGQNIAAELTGTAMTAKYIRGINLISSDMAGTVNYYLFNGHGDVIQLTNSSGNVVKTYNYDAFGNEKAPDLNDNNVFRYCGEYFDKETGTYYLRARYYNPVTGRFISEDSYLGSNNDHFSKLRKKS
ncbi:MAG: RHS repeat-associated core domain-containing protein [Clostridiaceae bacterium]|nr:RHS repeat-associated core domain-containing protein [Clostridiaceae bacterium]